MDDSGRLPGASRLPPPATSPNASGTPGASEKSSISLLSRTPVPPATRCAPNSRLMVVVSATAFPSLSTTDMWAVPASRAGAGADGPADP